MGLSGSRGRSRHKAPINKKTCFLQSNLVAKINFVSQLNVNLDLVKKYNVAGPRYTSYPPATKFTNAFTWPALAEKIAANNQTERDLSLYFHIPFCATACFYCGCNRIATKNRAHARPYLDRMKRELALQAEHFDTTRPVTQLHWGGGTPTFLSHGEMAELMAATARHFRLLPDAQASATC